MRTLLVLIKHPAVGQVKTRLGASIGPECAAALYRDWIGVILARVQPLRGQVRVVGFYDGAPLHQFREWEELADEWWSQPARSLGGRLQAGFERAFDKGAPVVAIGTDCLDVDSDLIQEAFERLISHDVVFGPAFDGGYYLVGAARNLPDFFRGIPWSSGKTLAMHQAICDRNCWSVEMLPTLRDIDTWEDWQAYCSERRAI